MRYNTGQISELVALFSPLSLAHLRSELDTKICIIEEMRTVFLSKKETMSVDYSHVLRKVEETVEKNSFPEHSHEPSQRKGHKSCGLFRPLTLSHPFIR